jgi:hypothetical protein
MTMLSREVIEALEFASVGENAQISDRASFYGASRIALGSQLRRIHYYDSETEKHFNFLTNNFVFSAQTIADLYRYRWQIELFFKWIKQHLQIKSFYGTSENAVKHKSGSPFLFMCLWPLSKNG